MGTTVPPSSRRSALLALMGLASLMPALVARAAESVVAPVRRGAALRLNEEGYQHAVQLIAQGHIALDGRGDWGAHRPSAEAAGAFIGAHGYAAYGTWFLALNDAFAEDVRRRYAYPFGDFDAVRRSALLAARSRAREWGHAEVEAAAERLLALIEPNTTS